MARFHVRATPPTSPLLFEYGRDFPDFIERYEHAQSMPWLADVARIERAWLDAYHAADAQPLAPRRSASSRRNGSASLSCRRIRQRGSCARAIRRSRSSRQTGATVQWAASRRMGRGCAGHAAGIRGGGQPSAGRRRGLSVAPMAGEPLGPAADAAMTDTPAFDLAAAIAGMFTAGVFASVREGGR